MFHHYNPRLILLALCLSLLAGYVDALGFLHLGGVFVSFMSGNSTRFAVGMAEGPLSAALVPGCIIMLFVLGVMAGSIIGHLFSTLRAAAVLCLVTGMLALAVVFHLCGQNSAAIAFVALAMGAENTVFVRDGEVSIGLTYMTGTLVKLGQRLAGILWGGPWTAALPYLLLWSALITGAVTGAFSYAHWGLNSLWAALILSAFLIVPAYRFRQDLTGSRA